MSVNYYHIDGETLLAYINGNLDVARCREVDVQIEQSPALQNELAAMRKQQRELQSVLQAADRLRIPNAALWDAIARRTVEQEQTLSSCIGTDERNLATHTPLYQRIWLFIQLFLTFVYFRISFLKMPHRRYRPGYREGVFPRLVTSFTKIRDTFWHRIRQNKEAPSNQSTFLNASRQDYPSNIKKDQLTGNSLFGSIYKLDLVNGLKILSLVMFLSISISFGYMTFQGFGSPRVAASPSLPLRTIDGATQVNVTIKSYDITPDTLVVPAGKVTFHVTNADPSLTHEMLVVHAQGKSFALPYNFNVSRVIEDQINKPGEVPNIQPNSSGDVTLDLPAGRYVLLCNLVGHYEAGMHTLIDVVPTTK